MRKRRVFAAAVLALNLALSACSTSVTHGEKTVESFGSDNISVIRVYEDTENVRIVPSETNEITVTYYKSSKKTYLLEVVDGVLTVQEKSTNYIIKGNQELTIAIPSSFAGALHVELDTGDCGICVDAALSMVSVNVDTGDIMVDDLYADQMFFTVDTGSISGTLAGNKSDYTISTHCDTGTCSLSDSIGVASGKTLKVEVDTGSIELRFVDGNDR